MKRPIFNVEIAKSVLQAALAWFVIMGFWPLTEIQQAATLTFGIGLLNLLGSYFESSQTTPLVEPKAKDGEPLVRSSNPTRSAAIDLRATKKA